MSVTRSDSQAGYLFTWIRALHDPSSRRPNHGFPVPAGPASWGVRPHVALPKASGPHVGALQGGRPPTHLRAAPPPPHATFCRQSYLPGEEPADADDAQDVEHGGAHDGPHSHVTLGDEDA